MQTQLTWTDDRSMLLCLAGIPDTSSTDRINESQTPLQLIALHRSILLLATPGLAGCHHRCPTTTSTSSDALRSYSSLTPPYLSTARAAFVMVSLPETVAANYYSLHPKNLEKSKFLKFDHKYRKKHEDL